MAYQIREKAIEIFRKSVYCLKKCIGNGLWIKLAGNPLAKPVQHPLQSLALGIAMEELPGDHFGKSFLQDEGHFGCSVFELGVGFYSK